MHRSPITFAALCQSDHTIYIPPKKAGRAARERIGVNDKAGAKESGRCRRAGWSTWPGVSRLHADAFSSPCLRHSSRWMIERLRFAYGRNSQDALSKLCALRAQSAAGRRSGCGKPSFLRLLLASSSSRPSGSTNKFLQFLLVLLVQLLSVVAS
jgi:hypothetical protein